MQSKQCSRLHLNVPFMGIKQNKYITLVKFDPLLESGCLHFSVRPNPFHFPMVQWQRTQMQRLDSPEKISRFEIFSFLPRSGKFFNRNLQNSVPYNCMMSPPGFFFQIDKICMWILNIDSETHVHRVTCNHSKSCDEHHISLFSASVAFAIHLLHTKQAVSRKYHEIYRWNKNSRFRQPECNVPVEWYDARA